ncbi:MAG: NmrA family protein [Caulobacteraceae bacterium]|jgi:putative NADH-flavin reductase|nr:NmrA family protein [Caulobacteraceae bacterium]
MKVIVFGAAGATGALLVRRSLERGHTITAFVRNPSAPTLEGVRAVHGDARDAAAVSAAIIDHDAVLLALGSRSLGTSDLLEVSSRNVIAAMERYGVRRLIALSAAGALHDAGVRQGPVGRAMLRVLMSTLLRNVRRDQAAQERQIEASGLDYTIVRPPFLTNGPASGRYRVDLDGLPAKAGPISRADVAAFMVDHLEDASFIRKGPHLAT